LVDGKDAGERNYQQSTNDSRWGIHSGNDLPNDSYGDEAGPFDDFDANGYVGRSIRELPGWSTVGSDNYEWRFTADCAAGIDGTITEGECVGWRGFNDGVLMEVPFALWNTGTTSDTSDDYRMLPLICEALCTEVDGGNNNHVELVFDIGGDHIFSGGANDPFSDYSYWYKPEDNGAAAGEAGYMGFFWGELGTGDRTFSRQIIGLHNGGTEGPYVPAMLEPGSIIEYVTKKPNQPGDQFAFNTDGYGTTAPTDSTKVARLSLMNVVPNPYLGASSYERSQLVDEVRFSNMPLEEATLRVYSLNGQLLTTLVKPDGANQLSWNLTTTNNLPIGSGMYLIHVTVKDVGTHVIKFAAVKKRIQLNNF
jgi:hypothetical protein